MLRRSLLFIIIALFLPAGAAFALPAAPLQTQTYQVSSALFDTMAPTPPGTNLATQGLLGYVATFHDDQYQYALPLCKTAVLAEVDDRPILPAGFTSGDLLAVTVQPDTAATAKSCLSRIIRQPANRIASGGECLQNYQVKHSLVGNPNPLVIGYEYTYQLDIYARPTIDCDADAYGASTISSPVAAAKPFLITLTRSTPSGASLQLTRWSITTDATGRASFTHTFTAADTTYAFHVTSAASTAAAGDSISWTAKVLDPHPAATLSPITTATALNLSGLPAIYVLLVILCIAAFAEFRHHLTTKRSHELPEQEYYRSSKL